MKVELIVCCSELEQVFKLIIQLYSVEVGMGAIGNEKVGSNWGCKWV